MYALLAAPNTPLMGVAGLTSPNVTCRLTSITDTIGHYSNNNSSKHSNKLEQHPQSLHHLSKINR